MGDAQQVAAAVAEVWGAPVRRASGAPRGHLHVGWRLSTGRGDWFVKLYRGAEWTPERVAETAALQSYLAGRGLPVPAVHPDREGRLAVPAAGGVLVAMDWVAGRALPPAALNGGHVSAIGAALGRAHRALAAYGGTPPPPFIPDPEEIRRRCEGLLEQLRRHPAPGVLHGHAVAALGLRLAALAARPIRPRDYAGRTWQPLHGDYYPGNLLWRAGRLAGIVDFDFAGWHWRSLETARAVVETAWIGPGAGEGGPGPAAAETPPPGAVDLDRAAACLSALHAAFPLSPADAAQLTRPWYNHLLHSVYPLHLYCAAPGSFPQSLVRLAWRRHRFLAWLHHHGGALDDLAARICG